MMCDEVFIQLLHSDIYGFWRGFRLSGHAALQTTMKRRTATLREGCLHLGSWVRWGRCSNSEYHHNSVHFHLIRLRMLAVVSTLPVIKSRQMRLRADLTDEAVD
ncbi:hypothetical protein V1264_013926 [Littorina saxatilis]|uniref:Uncharacterized protein n=1 Tax=Littorina saxatilis TaxID=31220 RepID=A0AAN9GIR9_9CAEN